MPAKHRAPRIVANLANFKLRIGRSRIERFGVFAGEAIPARKRVIEYTGERISEREGLRRAIKMLWAGKAGRIYTVRLDRRWKIDGSVRRIDQPQLRSKSDDAQNSRANLLVQFQKNQGGRRAYR
jgi:hypothetical protein